MRAQISMQLNTGTKPAGMLWLTALLLLMMAFLSPLSAQAQGNYVYVNNQASANTVSAYSVSAAGSLTELAGSPFSTGGVGANVVCYGLNRITLSPINNLLFVANTGNRTITSFQINPATGVLTRVAGSPFATALTLDSCQGISLAATPDGNFLMASSNGQIQTFSIAASGALTSIGLTPNCCSPNASMVISPNGQFLAVSNQTNVSMFVITPGTGALTPVPGSPFAKTGSGSLSGLDFSCAADRLYAGEATGSPAIADGWLVDNRPNLATTGVLTPAPGTPFTSSGNNSNLVLYSPDNTLLFESNQFTNSINSFQVNPDGSISNVGRFGGTTQVHTPAGMATDATGTLLYVADDNFGVAVFRIGNGGVLASLGDLAINRPGEIQDLVAYPARSCTSADLTLSMTAVPATAPAGAPIQYQLTITNKGPSVSSAVVADTFPPTLTAGGNSPIVNPAGAKRVNTVSGNTVSGNVTITTTVANQLFAGETVTVSSVPAPTTANPIQSGSFLTDPAFNGVFTITSVPSPNSFTYTQTIPLSQFPQPSLNIVPSTGANRVGGVVTITATQQFQLAPGTQITIAGVTNPSFNGTFTVASQPSATKFTYAQAGADAISGGGTVTAPTVVPPTDAAGGGSANNAACLVTVGSGTCGLANFAPHPVIVANTGANRAGNVVTITTTTPHQIFAGQSATISGVANTSFNGTFTVVSVPSPTTFTYKQTAANAISGGGSISVPATAAQLITFPALASGETRSALLTATTKTALTNGTIISNTANISNKSTVDPNPADNSSTASVTIQTQTATTLTVPTATGPYGGNATVTATLKTSGGTPIPNETIGFNFNQNNSVYNAVTNASGVATVVVPLGLTTVGTHLQAFTVTFGGDANFAASSALGDLIVTKAQLTVTADNQSRLYGDPNPPFTYVITGFVNGDTIAVVSGTADCSTAATQASPVGAYPITCTIGTLAAQNYVFAFVAGTLTINPAPLTVTVNNASRAYGAANPAFTGTITGLKNGDIVTATYSTTATPASPVGTYPITATLVDPNNVLGNYAVTINNGTLTVTPASLVVTANNAARLYGDPNPTFTGSIAGIVNGDNITATYTTTATPASPIGNYPIVPALNDPTNKLSNYVVTLNNGNLVVSAAPLTVTAANASRPYGAANPVFTGTITGIKNGDNITATYASPATATSVPGTYPIVPTLVDPTGKLSNYTVTTNNGTLTVTAALLTVTAADASRLYGDPNPAFTGTITGLVNGDNITATYASTADPTSPVGTYSIVPTLVDPNGKLVNYTVVINNGKLTVNPAPLTVTAANATRLYGAANPTFTGTITGIKNGDNITATYATTATATSNAGTYPITPTLVDPTNKLSNYTVTSNNGTLTITPAPLTVSAANASRLYGDANPVFTGTITGLLNGDNITATYASAATPASPVGTYPIVPTLVDPTNKLSNYTVTSNNGTLTITPAPLTVTAANASRPYGAANPAFTGTITGIKNGDNITASYASPATANSPAGPYPIIPTLVDPTGKLGNYTVTSTNGTLTVTAASLVVTAANASRFYGDPNPVFAGTLTGVAPGDNITATYASVADPTSAPGTYAIVPTLVDPNGKLANYTVVINNGTLTVNAAPLTVTAADASRAYGAANPAFSGTITGIKNGDNITATYASAATATSNAGTYPIVPTLVDPTAKLSNYAVTINNGTLTVTPVPLTVTAANASRIYGDANPAFSGTVTGLLNGDNITATYSTTATAASAVGTYPITPALVDPTGKLGNYTVTSNNGTLTITPAPLTVSAANATKAFGDPNPVFTGTLTGIKNNDNISATYSSTATAASPVGTYPITPALVDPTGKLSNYTVTSNNGTLTVTSAPLVVTAANASRFYGDPNPVFTGTITGVKNGDNITATFSSVATAASAPGTYAIVPTLVDPNNKAGNYTVIINNGVLSVNAAPLSVTAANASRAYGASNPAFTGTISGLKNGDNITASYTTVADPTSNVGSYAITPVLSDPTNKLSNYAVTLTNGSLTITPVPLTVTANNASRVYGDPNPAFTGTITGLLNNDNITFSATSAAPTAAVGTYPIVPALVDPTGKLINYTVTSNNGILTVTPAPLSVTAANATRAYGDPNPAFTGTLTGVKNGDNITASYSTTAVATSAPGSYPITPALADPTAKLSNYTVTSTNGTLTVTTATLTVAAANASMIYGDPLPALTGTITGLKNGDAITATFSTTATSASPVGTYPITSALSDPTGKLSNYTVVTNNGLLTISPAPLAVSAANASRAYGSANPAFTGTLTGVKNGDNITATYASATDATTNVGTYPIVPTLADPTAKLSNYTVTSTNGTLTITQVPLTVVANSASRIYGDPNPAFTGTITGLLNGDNITFSATSVDPTAAVGTYPIVPVLVDPNGKLVNYSVTSTNGTLTITQAPLSLVAANSSRAYGDPNNLSGTLTGVKNGDNITASYSTTATAASAPGTYPITASLLDPTNKLGNYSVTITNATLTVTPATLTVTAANASMVYGDAVPALSGTIAGIKNGDNITASYSTTATPTSAPGTYPIAAAVSDNATGALANYTVVINNGTLTISPAPLVVTAANASRLYGDPNPAFTGTITGLKNGDNIGAIFSAAADPTSPVGNYAIIPTLTDPNNKLGNYAITLNNGVLSVAPAPLSVAAADNSRLYGDPNPAFTGTLTGIKNADNITATYASAADPTSPVGTYPIVPTLVDPTNKLANYVVTSTNGTLTVNPAPLTIQANNASAPVGGPFPTFTGTITGLRNTDVVTASYSTTATTTSPAGTYPIIPSADPSPALGNYAVTLINGTLTLQ